MTKRGHRPGLAGVKCPECGHAVNSHNDLAYCEVRSKTYGDCMCGMDGWTKERMAEDRAQCRADARARRRCNVQP